MTAIQVGADGVGSPMQKRRAWSTFDDDVDARETAALEASVAAAKDRAAESGALLSSTKDDLTDYQRWLRAQNAAVEKDRERHERWLRRQRDERLATAKKERGRRQRRAVRQRAVRAVRQAFAGLFALFGSWIALGFGKAASGARALGRSATGGLQAVWRGIAHAASSMGLRARHAAAVAGLRLTQGAASAGAKFGKAARGAGEGLAAGAAWSGEKATASARAGGQAFSARAQAAAAEAGQFSRTAGSAIGSGLSSASKKGAALASGGMSWALSRAQGIPPKFDLLAGRVRGAMPGVKVPDKARPREFAMPVDAIPRQAAADKAELDGGAPSEASAQVPEAYGFRAESAAPLDRPSGDPWIGDVDPGEEVHSPEWSGAGTRLPRQAGPSGFLKAGGAAASAAAAGAAGGMGRVLSSWGGGMGARTGAFSSAARASAQSGWTWLRQQGARASASARAGTEAAIVWAETWAGKKGLDVSHMMILAGAILLVFGGLLIGGGLLMRASSGSVIAAEVPDETFSKVSWLFDQPDVPLSERAVFTLSGTPRAFLVNGISIGGINNSEEPLTGLQAVLRPDVRRPDLRLEIVPGLRDDAGAPAEGAPVPAATVRPGEVFRLVFPFPPEAMGEEDGISAEDYFESYGGLLLTLRYKADGVEKTVIQYLAPGMLKAQLDEVSAQAGDS